MLLSREMLPPCGKYRMGHLQSPGDRHSAALLLLVLLRRFSRNLSSILHWRARDRVRPTRDYRQAPAKIPTSVSLGDLGLHRLLADKIELHQLR